MPISIQQAKSFLLVLPSTILLFFNSCQNSSAQEQAVQEKIAEDSIITTADQPMDETIVIESVIETIDTIKRNKAVKKMKPPLIITIAKLKSPIAPVVIGVYGTKNNFLDEKDQLKEYTFKPVNGKLVAKITDLPYGVYGIALYQDLNSDGVINKSIIGIPKEPYAFSNNIKPKFKAPSFGQCKFVYSESKASIRIALL
jgi:uncharacterized protein (DUF2141 family)